VTYLNATDVKITDTRVPTVIANQGASAVAKPTLPTCAKNPRIYRLPALYVGKTILPTTEDALYTKDSKDPETRRTPVRTHPFQPSPANQTTTINTLNKTTQRVSPSAMSPFLVLIQTQSSHPAHLILKKGSLMNPHFPPNFHLSSKIFNPLSHP